MRNAQEATKHLDARINPYLGAPGLRSREVVNVQFDVAIKDTKGSAAGGKISVLAGVLGGNVKGEMTEDSSAATSLRFTVPMMLPSESDAKKAVQG